MERQCVHPCWLERNPDLKKSILQCATSNLNELTAELLLACLHDAALPALLEKFKEELGNPQQHIMHDLFQEHGMSKLSMSTVHRWMRRLGFKCEPRKKCCCVDGHTLLLGSRAREKKREKREGSFSSCRQRENEDASSSVVVAESFTTSFVVITSISAMPWTFNP
jgi:hypothetical protein